MAVHEGPGATVEGNADYVPSFGAPQLFRWKGHWIEITRLKDNQSAPYGTFKSFSSLQLMSDVEVL
jgi:chaperone BCS1